MIEVFVKHVVFMLALLMWLSNATETFAQIVLTRGVGVEDAPATLAIMQVRSTPALVAGGVVGAGAGLLAGGLGGALIGGNSCTDAGNPDSCSGFEGMLAGASLGMSVGIPVGVHIANRRQGTLVPSLALSLAMPVLVHLVARATDDDRYYTGLLLVPFAQLGTSIAIER